MGREPRQINLNLILFCIGICSVLFDGNAQYESYNKPYDLIGRKPGLMRHYTMFAPSETSAEKFDRMNL